MTSKREPGRRDQTNDLDEDSHELCSAIAWHMTASWRFLFNSSMALEGPSLCIASEEKGILGHLQMGKAFYILHRCLDLLIAAT